MNSREVALNIINRVLIEGAYSNLVLSNELNEADLNDKDRALVTELVYGTIRRKKTLDMIISNYIKDISLMDERVLNILRMAIYGPTTAWLLPATCPARSRTPRRTCPAA